MNKRQYKKYLKKLKCKSYSKMREKMRREIAYYKKLAEFNVYEYECAFRPFNFNKKDL